MIQLKAYVFNNVEVRKTGRTATKPLPSGKKDVLYEVTPIDSIVGTWRQWVRDNDLFEVTT